MAPSNASRCSDSLRTPSDIDRAALIVRLRVVSSRPLAGEPRTAGADPPSMPADELVLDLLEVLKGTVSEARGSRLRATVVTTGPPEAPRRPAGPWSDLDRDGGRELVAFCGVPAPGASLGQTLARDAFFVLATDDDAFPRAVADVRAAVALEAEGMPGGVADVETLAPFGPLLGAFLHVRCGPSRALLRMVEDTGAAGPLRVELLMRLVDDARVPIGDLGDVRVEDLLAAMIWLLIAPEVPGLQSRIRQRYLALVLGSVAAADRVPSLPFGDPDEREGCAETLAAHDDVFDRGVATWLRGGEGPWHDDAEGDGGGAGRDPVPSAGAPRDDGYPVHRPPYDPEPDPVPRGEPVAVDCRIDSITVSLPRTRPLTVRGNDVADDPAFRSLETDESFEQGQTLVVLEQARTELVLTAGPAGGGGVVWEAPHRSPDDAASVGAANALPSFRVDPNDARRAFLTLDQRGSFVVRVRCADPGDEDAPAAGSFRVLKVVMVEAAWLDDASTTSGRNTSARIRNGVLQVRFGRHRRAPRAGIAFDARALLLGGGANGRRGLNRVRAGWINNVTEVDAVARYRGGRRVRALFAANPRQAAGPAGLYFLPGGAAPVPLPPPLLDTGRDPAGTGGDKATLTQSDLDLRLRVRNGGQVIRVVAFDAPGIPVVVEHPGFPGAVLQRYDLTIRFRAFLALWTREHQQRYVVLRRFDWTASLAVTRNANGALAVAAGPAITISGERTFDRARARAEAGAEVRAPDGLSRLTLDARR